MAKLIVKTNMNSGAIELSSSKKIEKELNQAKKFFLERGFSKDFTDSILAQYILVNLSDYKEKRRLYNISNEDINDIPIFEGIYILDKESLIKGIQSAISSLLEEDF